MTGTPPDQAIQVRKELTDEWDARGVQRGIEYAILTDEISRAWSGMTTIPSHFAARTRYLNIFCKCFRLFLFRDLCGGRFVIGPQKQKNAAGDQNFTPVSGGAIRKSV